MRRAWFVERNPVLLIASVSPYEAQRLEQSLQGVGWNLLAVHDADEVAELLDRSGARVAVLVIDSGLLEMPHDAQWRRLRTVHPELGTVVRCLSPRRGLAGQRDSRALEVHPDDAAGIRDAVRWLCPPLQWSHPAPPVEEMPS